MSLLLARNGHVDSVAQCPLLGAKRKTCARIELFRFGPIAVLLAPPHDCCAPRLELPAAQQIFIVETGQLPSWFLIEIRRPWNSSSQSLSTIPAFPLVSITASATSSVRALSNSTRIVQA